MHKYWQLIKHDHWVFPYLKQYRGLLTLVLFLGTMTFFCGGALMFTSGYLISRSAQRPENILMVYAPIVLTRAFGIGRPSFRYAERLVSHNWVLKIVSRFRQRLYLIVEQGTKSIYAKAQTGEVFNVLANDLFKIENFYLRLLFPTIIGWLIYIVVTLVIGIFNPLTALLILLVLGLDTIMLPLITVAVRGARDYQQKQLERKLYTDLTDAVMGLQDWILSGRTNQLLADQETDFHNIGQLQGKNNHFEWWRACVAESVLGLVVIILVVFATHTFGQGYLSVNWIAAFGLVVFPLSDAFASISTGFGEWPRYADSIKRLNQLEQTSLTDAQDEVAQIEHPQNGPINFNQVTFYYQADTPVLTDINLTVQVGEHLAILGQSGAGKTTLLKLLLGDEHPQKGMITIAGVPVTALSQHRATLISVLDQKPYLFATTVANNLRLGNLQASDDVLWEALAKVQLKELVQQLPDGLDTPMTEAGKRFSGGERQRFALARILIQDTPIVILDEPTVGLDPITELAVLKTIFTSLADKTIIWVTHHLTGVDLADEVIFIDQQGISLAGTPAELLQTSSRFAHLLALDRGDF